MAISDEHIDAGVVNSHLPRTIAISSGKGGVGKSSITVNLAISLAKMGAKVCVFDADTGLANVNILLGLRPEHRLEHVLFGAKSLEDVLLEGPHGIQIVPGAHGISECVDLHPRQRLRLTKELAAIEEQFDYLLIDTAAGISETTLDFICSSQHALVVITPEPTSLTDAFSLIKLLKRRRSHVHYHVVVNMCSSAGQAKEFYHRFNRAVAKYVGVSISYLGFLLRDESLRAAVTLQNPVALFPDTDPSSRGFIRLAEAVEAATRDPVVSFRFSAYWQQLYVEQNPDLEQESDEGEPRIAAEKRVVRLDSGRGEDSVDSSDEDQETMATRVTSLMQEYQDKFQQSPLVLAQQHGLIEPPQPEFASKEVSSYIDDMMLAGAGGAPSPGTATQLRNGVDLDGASPDSNLPTLTNAKKPIVSEEAHAWKKPHPHFYEQQLFGDQDQLVALLQSDETRSLTALELIGSLAED